MHKVAPFSHMIYREVNFLADDIVNSGHLTPATTWVKAVPPRTFLTLLFNHLDFACIRGFSL